jgi:hypothetical protein
MVSADLGLAKKPASDAARRTAIRRRWRASISTVCVLGVLAWWAIAATGGRNEIYNPGPVSAAHSLWENDCARCHDNDGKGGFRAAVSDNACLSCHNAAAHSPKQLVREPGQGHSPLVLAVSNGHGRLRSADCVVCHVEHRGRHAVAIVDDAHCVRCHTDLRPALAPGSKAEVANHITRFDMAGGHPYFGREYVPKELPATVALPSPPAPANLSSLFDPTRLKFNHKVHMREVKPAAGETENCSLCHNDGSASDHGTPSQSRRYMQPVSFASHCQSCHPLNLPSGASVVHATMEAVEAQLMSLDELHRQWALRLPQAERQKTLQGQTLEAWAAGAAAKVRQTVGDWLLEMSPSNAHGAEEAARAIQEFLPGDDKAGSDPRALALYIAFGAHDQPTVKSSSCVKCHDMQDMMRSASSPAQGPSTQPALPVLATLATGITSTPRRWFKHSLFDHSAHEGISCVGCHSTAPTSEKTSDLLLPNLIWTDNTGASVSCAHCHHLADSDGRGAPNHCVTCHWFHDRAESAPAMKKQGVLAFFPGSEAPRPSVATQAVVRLSNAP